MFVVGGHHSLPRAPTQDGRDGARSRVPYLFRPRCRSLAAAQTREPHAKLFRGQDRLARIRLTDGMHQACGARGRQRRAEPIRLVEQRLIRPIEQGLVLVGKPIIGLASPPQRARDAALPIGTSDRAEHNCDDEAERHDRGQQLQCKLESCGAGPRSLARSAHRVLPCRDASNAALRSPRLAQNRNANAPWLSERCHMPKAYAGRSRPHTVTI